VVGVKADGACLRRYAQTGSQGATITHVGALQPFGERLVVVDGPEVRDTGTVRHGKLPPAGTLGDERSPAWADDFDHATIAGSPLVGEVWHLTSRRAR
jgi:hypothetical protein